MEISLRPIDVHLDRQDRIHPFLLPVPFRSGSCVVLVGPSHPRWIPSWRLPYIVSPPLVSDSAMYHQVWPEVKRGASVIIRRCRFKRERFSYAGFSGKCFTAGIFRGSTLLEEQPFYSQVIVRDEPRLMPWEVWTVYLHGCDGL